MEFKANRILRTIEGLNCQEIAIKWNQHEIVRLLKFWDEISKSLLYDDFCILWKNFLQDPEAIVSNLPDAKRLLVELG